MADGGSARAAKRPKANETRKQIVFKHEGQPFDPEAFNNLAKNEPMLPQERPMIIASVRAAYHAGRHFVSISLQYDKEEISIKNTFAKYASIPGKTFVLDGDIAIIKRYSPNETACVIETSQNTPSYWTWNSETGIERNENPSSAPASTAVSSPPPPSIEHTRTLAALHTKINELEAKLQEKNKELAEAKKPQRPPTANDLMAKRPGQESIGDLKTKLRTVNCNVDRLEAQLATATSTIKAKEAEITKYKELDFKTTVAAAEEATLRLELDNLKAKNADLEAQIKQCKDDFLAFALDELRGKYDCVRTCITPIQGKVYTDSEYRDLITQYSGLVKPNGIIVQQLEKEIANLKAAATKRLIDADTMAQEHRRELEKANASLQAQVTAQSDDVKQAINNAERVKELEQLLLRARAEMQTKELIIQGERDQFTDEKAEMETRLATAKRLIDEAGGNPNHIHLAGNEVYLKIKDYMQHEPLWQDQTQHMLKHTLSLFGISYQAFQQKTHAKENQRLNSKIMGLEANINRHTAVVENLQQQLTASKKHASSLQCAIDGYNIERLRTGWQVAPTYVPGVNQVVAANIVAALKDVHAMAKAAKLEADQILAKYAKVEKIEERVETATNELKYHRNKACREHNNDAYLALTYVHNLLHPHNCLS